ncbi:hypothetical protein Tco_0018953 [Tanacetum coccineum]
MPDSLRDIYRTLESRYVHEVRTIDPSFYNDLSYDLVANFTAIGIYIYSDAWGLDELKKTLEQIEPYNSRLPALDDIRNLIHRRTVYEKVDKEGDTVYKLPNKIETNELFDHLRPCELVIRENVYSAIGNRDHTQAVIALMLYCLQNGQPFNLAYFIIRRMYFFRDRRDKVLPYGMILTRLFKNLKGNIAQNSFDERYKLIPRKMSSLKAKQPKRPPPKRTRNVGKSKCTQLSISSSTESPPLDNGDLPGTTFTQSIIGLLRMIRTCPRNKGRQEEPQELPPPQISPNDPYAQTMDNWPPGPSNPSPPPRVSRPPPGFPNPPPGFEPLPSTQPLFVNINNNTPLLHNNAPPLENIHHPPPNLGNQDFPNPPNILDFVHPNDMPHLHNMFCQCCSTTRHEI